MSEHPNDHGQATHRRIVLPDISSRAWEHPADRGALVALRQLHGFDTVLRKLSGFFNERMLRVQLLGSAVRVNQRQFPKVFALYTEAARVLDVTELPELYVQNSPWPNAMTIGVDSPKIVLNSRLLDLLDEEELRFTLGHELGHALSGHALYRTLLDYLLTLGTTLAGGIPFGIWGLRAITAGLSEWSRKSELSCDRAGLLACQDVQAAHRMQMKLASGGHLADLDLTEFLDQAREYEATSDLRDSVIKLMLLERQSHPFMVVRAGELHRWVDSGAYASILAGDYPRRSQDRDTRISAEAQAAADSYAENLRRSDDALAKVVRDIGDGLTGLAGRIGNRFRQPPP